jgi:U3 small nucleolar RNA-associated protein MPP10
MDETFTEQVLNKPHRLLLKDESLHTQWLAACQALFNDSKPFTSNNYGLYTEGFDMTGIWNQMELVTGPAIDALEKFVEEHGLDGEGEVDGSDEEASLEGDEDLESLGNEEDVQSLHTEEEEDLEQEEAEETFVEGEEEIEIPSDEDEEEAQERPKRKRSEVDDDFFSLEDMEKFTELGEARDIKMSKMDKIDSDEEEDEEDMFSIGKGAFILYRFGPRHVWR